MKDALLSKGFRGWFTAVAITVFMVAGCGRDGPELFPVQGKVTLDGKPLADAGVMFLPAETGPSATGTTDSNGHFELMTVNSIGAIRGTHPVVVAKRKYVPIKPGEEPSPGGVRAEWYSPKKYANPSTSGLSAEVGEGDNNFHFELLSQ
jgi:predicted small lipoprotein YifL